jgi:UDP-N-acetylmuramoyl-L-alanyl-D-glutamate--2,6-diaminopimelate ligase
MKNLIRKAISQKDINNFYHLPKAIVANILHGFPSKKLTVIGVTGTDGKTTTTNMIYQILKDAGKKVSMISTINAVIGGKAFDTGFHVTSPDPFMVQEFIKSAKLHGDEYLILEVTSHALDQYRFWGIKFDVGVITNITHEHLDYHKTFESYKNTKLKLVKNVNFAVVNEEIGLGDIKGKKITFGLEKGDFNQKDLKLKLKIPGNYNIENALAALAVAFVLNIPKLLASKTLEKFESLEGRMESVKNNLGIKIIIDFAHTPNGLESVLKTLKSETKTGKIISVFGAAAQRDKQKRPMMGSISARYANITILTDEDPRDEDRDRIIGEIAKGAYKDGLKDNINLFKQTDRQRAIELAISLAKKGDIIGIFGKGHEKSMNYHGKEIPWSDKKAVEKILKNLS